MIRYLAPIITFIVSLIITAVSEKFMIPLLRELKFGQIIREDGPESHQKKAGTPTMGGICMTIAVILSSTIGLVVAIFTANGDANYNEGLIKAMTLILILTVGYSAVGFTDDYLKIKKKNNEGLTVKQKLLCQGVVTALFIVLYIIWNVDISIFKNPYSIRIPFVSSMVVLPAVVFVVLAIFVLLGTDNGTNLTDGLDGLLSFVSIPVTIVLTAMSYSKKVNLTPELPNAVAIVSMAMLGALIGFLIYNHYPAKVFMGDTGSLMIGGYVAASAMCLHVEIYIILFGFVYLMESMSDILQVGYFKLSHGKRIFRMAPIHHHFEKGGWSEVKVVTVFTIISCVGSILAFVLL
ncbi:MAG: phospho-N-acetylmuramoyl-pentapeptide-transferase [Lachnospiraceae bacterium]|nr:phospho-N-acetylmuramoyl-pentapeptide-transferase [Lachnospiraceae bacterium]